jgi:hypothetical protein
MLFSIIILLMILAVAYFQYAQGFFSATLSAICTIFAALIAFSFYEPLVNTIFQGKMADQSHPLALVVLFALSYVILRVIFDKAVPGNIAVPLLVDKIGAGLMGVVAAVFAAGIFSVAAQMLPFGPSIGGFTRYPTADRGATASIPGQRNVDITISDELRSPELDPKQASTPLIPAGEAVTALVSHLSDNGSLSNGAPFDAVHPDFLNELFAQRLGIQLGAKHTAINFASQPAVSVKGIYLVRGSDSAEKGLPEVDAELPSIRGPIEPTVKKGEEILKSDVLIFRTSFSSSAADEDQRVRISTGAVHLAGNGVLLHPLGTLNKGVLYRNRPDDYIIIPVQGSEATADFVFLMAPELVDNGGDPKTPGKMVADAVYEAKRGGIVAVGGMPITDGPPPAAENVGVLTKKVKLPAVAGAAVAAAAAGAPAAQAAAAASAPLTIKDVAISDKLFQGINVGYSGSGAQDTTFASGTASIRDGKLTKLTVNANQSLQLLSQNTTLDTFFVPQGMKMVQVSAEPPTATGSDPWGWAQDLSGFTLVDGKNQKHQPYGAWAKVSQGAAQKMVGRYDSSSPVTSVSKEDGRPMDVWIAFLIADGTKIKDLSYQGKSIHTVGLDVK